MALVIFGFLWSPFCQVLNSDIRRISDDAIEPAPLHDPPEAGGFGIPVERVDAVAFLVAEESTLIVDVRADERIAADDVVFQFGQDRLLGRQLRFLALHSLP